MTRRQKYTCEGRVRGSCDKQHRTMLGAFNCCESDGIGCKRQGGYSDRSPVHTDGSPLDADERALLRAWEESPPGTPYEHIRQAAEHLRDGGSR